MKDLIILEFKEELDYILRHRPDLIRQDTLVLSLMPEVSALLQEQHIAYMTTLGFFAKASHEKCLSYVDTTCLKLEEALKIVDRNGISETYHNTLIFYLRLYISYIVFMIEVIGNIREKHGLHQIYGFRYAKTERSLPNIGKGERLMGELLAGFLSNDMKVSFFDLTMGPAPALRLNRFLKSVVNWLYGLAESLWLKTLKGPSIVFYSMEYNLETIARNIKGFNFFNLLPRRSEFLKSRENKGGCMLYHLHMNDFSRSSDGTLKGSLRRSLDQIKALHQDKGLFSFNNIDYAKIVFDKFEACYIPTLKRLGNNIVSLKRILQTVHPAVVIAALSRDSAYALGELSKKMRIPSVLISHGSHVPPKNEFDRSAWLDHGKGLIDTPYQYHLTQTPWARAYADEMSQQKSYYNIQPLVFKRIDRSVRDQKIARLFPRARGKKIVVHASTPKSRRAPRFFVYETMDEYIEHIRDLIKATAEAPDIFLVIRFRPSSDLGTEDLKKLLPAGDHYVIATQGSFADTLVMADLLVSFSSTTIEEALLNNIPVLQYDRTGRYEHIEGVKWQGSAFNRVDSVYWLGDAGALMPGLRWIIMNQLRLGVDLKLFARHQFGPGEVPSAQTVIRNIIEKKSLVGEAAYAQT